MLPTLSLSEEDGPEQRATLDAAVRDGWLKIEVIDDLAAVSVFTELIEHSGGGEAACIALAAPEGLAGRVG